MESCAATLHDDDEDGKRERRAWCRLIENLEENRV